MTGAPVPQGADVVIGFENTDEPTRQTTSKGYPDEIGILLSESSAPTSARRAKALRSGAGIAAGYRSQTF
jgi:hypothetical protein